MLTLPSPEKIRRLLKELPGKAYESLPSPCPTCHGPNDNHGQVPNYPLQRYLPKLADHYTKPTHQLWVPLKVGYASYKLQEFKWTHHYQINWKLTEFFKNSHFYQAELPQTFGANLTLFSMQIENWGPHVRLETVGLLKGEKLIGLSRRRRSYLGSAQSFWPLCITMDRYLISFPVTPVKSSAEAQKAQPSKGQFKAPTVQNAIIYQSPLEDS